MIVRLSSSVVRGLFVLLAVFLAAGLCYSAISNALAQHFVGFNTLDGYERAARLEPDDARIWYSLGRYWQYNLSSPDAQRAISDYQKSLSLNAHSAEAWADLAIAYETEGDITAARKAFLQAQRAYPLSPDISWRYGNFLLRRGEMDLAFAEIRHAVQLNPKLGPAAFVLCMHVQPDIQIVLDRALPASADGLIGVIDALAEQKKTEQALIVWSRLAAVSPHLAVSESYSLIEALLQKHQIGEAQRVWNDALNFAGISPPPGVPGSLVWDGGFESNVQGGGFAWRYPPSAPGVQVSLDSKEKHSGNRSLRLTFNGLSNVNFDDVCQFVAVRPSTSYVFSAWVRPHALSTDQGVRFGLTSLGDSGSVLSWTDDVRGTQPWSRISFDWDSKPDVHAVRICVGRLPSAKFDNKIHGIAWVDDVALVPQSAENTTQ
ncbi:MAG TPA: tetratricopeptide repeat protein [Candidatus Methylomirabilis sp.]|nr:tetratricopeptide repeat protein [Candidatus Methylomirabilis sp.]